MSKCYYFQQQCHVVSQGASKRWELTMQEIAVEFVHSRQKKRKNCMFTLKTITANFEWKWLLLPFFPGWRSDRIDVLAASNTNVKLVETPFCKAKTVSFWENTRTRPRLPGLAPGIVIPDMAHTLMCRWRGYGFCPSVLNRVYNLERVDLS